MKSLNWLLLLLLIGMLSAPGLRAKDSDDEDDTPKLNSGMVSALSFRSIGPALMSGRIGDIAIDPIKKSTWYIAVSSGNVWKTENAGTTFEPIFDSYGSYSIGCVAVDPNNRHVVWVGTGENNSQRSVSYGDGVYKSLDGGGSFENVGLKSSEHISMILIDPRNSEVVYVASQGPLWAKGGERGLYKTTDGGTTWELSLEISENTGITEVHFDPRNPDILYAAAYQRRRHTWTLINGGPESDVYKSTDAGASWNKINKGLPSVDKGRIGLAVSPINPDVIYAIVEAAQGKSGFYRSSDGGQNWNKQSDYVSGSPQYYQEIFADPLVFDRIYSMDTWLQVSDNGGKSFTGLGEEHKHVDNHAMAFDPDDVDHLIVGCDGGLYETWDRGQNWDFKANLPITQFYKMALDNAFPFYNVYGGTQDNATQGGPSRTTFRHGIRNSDWYVTVGGDGFDPAIDPEDPNIVYAQSQYGNLVRHDRKTGLNVDIKPQESADGPPLRWNWDAALMISPHLNTRLYYGSQILFQSDDRGDSWQAISPDLTRNSDRNKLKVFDRVLSIDAVAKNRSTSYYGTIVSVSESTLEEGLLYVGTDDGLIQVSEDAGGSWTRHEDFDKVPNSSYVSDIEASLHNADIVYAVLDNHKQGDFKPYIVKSDDRGKSWKSISGDLPERGTVYALAQDHLNEQLLFAATEFGVFFTIDEGTKWVQLSSGIPTIAVRDLEIQRRENDLVAATFGRGFYILDDYTPLRHLTDETLQTEAFILPIKKTWMYIENGPLGWRDKGSQGASYFTTPNPEYGATFSWYLKESLTTRESKRRKEEGKLAKDSADVFYPTWAALKAEDREEEPVVFMSIRDDQGVVVRRLSVSNSSGLHRSNWDLRHADQSETEWGEDDAGPMALPGKYTVSLSKRVDGVTTELVGPTEFEITPLGMPSIPEKDRAEVLAFQKKTGALQRAVVGANRAANEAADQIDQIKSIIAKTISIDPALYQDARTLELRLMDLREKLDGDRTKSRRAEPARGGIRSRVNNIIYGHWWTNTGPTRTHERDYQIAAEAFVEVLDGLRQLIESDLVTLQQKLEAAGAPWSKGRALPQWTP